MLWLKRRFLDRLSLSETATHFIMNFFYYYLIFDSNSKTISVGLLVYYFESVWSKYWGWNNKKIMRQSLVGYVDF